MSLKRKLARLPRPSISTPVNQQVSSIKPQVEKREEGSVPPENFLLATDTSVVASLKKSRDGADRQQSTLSVRLEHYQQVYSARQRRRSSDLTSTATSVPIAAADASTPEWETTIEQQDAVRIMTHRLSLDYQQGVVPVCRALRQDTLSLSRLALSAEWAEVDLHRVVFLDTETTGLGGGTGIIPFLIGLAWFEDETLVVQQLLLEELGEEEDMMARVHERVAQATGIVSYNGKTYDWPLLRTRAVMTRRPPLPTRPHLDLLHCARRVYRKRLGHVRLVDIEEHVLQMRRHEDISGEEIPSVYWQYLEDRNETDLDKVIVHNVHDLISLVATLVVLTEHYTTLHPDDDPRDQLCRAKVGFRAQDWGRAEQFAQAVVEGQGSPEVIVEAAVLWARLCGRRRDYERAVSILHQATDKVAVASVFAAALHLEIAKIYEHRLKVMDLAWRHAQYTAAAEGLPAQEKRLSRLQRRCKRLAVPITSQLFGC
ncbi:MAG: ribonuclease H-like domain-containing protein [Myxococcales bacterium]|nr:ribonuclease H-like domain-containing protein [Myxococcales bacterium]